MFKKLSTKRSLRKTIAHQEFMLMVADHLFEKVGEDHDAHHVIIDQLSNELKKNRETEAAATAELSAAAKEYAERLDRIKALCDLAESTNGSPLPTLLTPAQVRTLATGGAL